MVSLMAKIWPLQGRDYGIGHTASQPVDSRDVATGLPSVMLEHLTACDV